MQTIRWGEIPYIEATHRQLELVESLAAQEESSSGAEGFLCFCTHPPVVTMGRATRPGDVFGWTGERIETSRGGRATYHGPNQIVVYPILNLRYSRESFSARDVHGYLRALEISVVETLKEFGISAEIRSAGNGPDEASLTGVWASGRKLASIGIAVKKWITYHGLALNVEADSRAFSGIRPCGFDAEIMTSMEDLLGAPVDRGAVEATLEKHLRSLCHSSMMSL